MISKIRLHIFIGTTVTLFGWYYLVDSLPRSKLIPEYVARVSEAAGAAAVNGGLASLAVEQPMFYLDNPVVSVRDGEAGAYVIQFSQVSKRRCEQIAGNKFVKERASQILVARGSCGDWNEVGLVMSQPDHR